MNSHRTPADLTGTSKWPGVVSAAITMSDVKDEIDWEWTGTSLNNAQTNVWFLGVANCQYSFIRAFLLHRCDLTLAHMQTLPVWENPSIWA